MSISSVMSASASGNPAGSISAAREVTDSAVLASVKASDPLFGGLIGEMTTQAAEVATLLAKLSPPVGTVFDQRA